MGYRGKLEEKEKARKLRAKGLSYREILKQVKVSKDSISRWCRDIELTKKQLERLYLNKKTGALRGSIKGAKLQQRRREERTKKLALEGIKEVGSLNKREFFIGGITLYAAEGSKRDERFNFANSDPELIKYMACWLRKFCKPDESRIRGFVYIHDNLDELIAKKFWSKVADIPLHQFRKSYIAKNKKNKLRKQLHKYGIFSIYICDADLKRKIDGWIKGAFANTPS